MTQVTSYSIVASEYASYADQPRGPSKKSKKPAHDDSESEGEIFGRALAQNTRKGASKKKVFDALFHVNWWRIVLGSRSSYIARVEL